MGMPSNGHNGDNGHHRHNGWLMRNGRSGGNGHARPIAGGCPKCEGCVLERYDPYVGWEPYCVNCGWTPLTALEAHRIPEAERRALVELRRWGQRWVLFSQSVSRPGGR